MGTSHRPTTLAQRLEILERSLAKETDAHIGNALHLGKATVRKWRRRAKRLGRSGLASSMGRPPTGPLGQFSPPVREVLRNLRVAHPGWGPVTLLLEADKDPRLSGQKLPDRSRVAAFLKAEGLTHASVRHARLPQPETPPAAIPHEEWQMDAQGVRRVADIGSVSVINVGDPYTHVRVGSLACLHKVRAVTPDYQLALRRSFLQYGLPHRLSLDHDTVFFENTSSSPYPSQLHWWLIALGVLVTFIDRGRPTQHGFIEHTHQLLDGQALADRHFASPATLQPTLDQRREFLNQEYPSRVLAGHPPLEVYPGAVHSGRPYHPEAESELLHLERVYQYLAPPRWFRLTSDKGQFFLGGYRYGLGQNWAAQMMELRLAAETSELVCYTAAGVEIHRFPAKGRTQADLMGEFQLEQFPSYQYAFPWSVEVCRQNLMYQAMGGTT
jgi:hypothetical protein